MEIKTISQANAIQFLYLTAGLLWRASWWGLAAATLVLGFWGLQSGAREGTRPETGFLDEQQVAGAASASLLRIALPFDYDASTKERAAQNHYGWGLESGHVLQFQNLERRYRMALYITSLRYDPLVGLWFLRVLFWVGLFFFVLHHLREILRIFAEGGRAFFNRAVARALFLLGLALFLAMPIVHLITEELMSGYLSDALKVGSGHFDRVEAGLHRLLKYLGMFMLIVGWDYKNKKSSKSAESALVEA